MYTVYGRYGVRLDFCIILFWKVDSLFETQISSPPPRSSQARAFFEKEGASRFENENHPNSERLSNRAGFFYTDNAGYRIFMVLSEVYRKEICQGFEPKMVNKVLINSGWIVPGNDGKASQKRRIKGVGIPRCYVFTEKVWSDDF